MPSRTKRDRLVAVTVNPAEPLPEIHVAPDVPTLLLFPADIQKKTITVDQSRIRVRDAGASSIIVLGNTHPVLRASLLRPRRGRCAH